MIFKPRHLILPLILLFSCSRASNGNVTAVEESKARPMAILQTGSHPLWFQLTEDGTVLIESIEDAVMSAAFVPWPLALHVRFFHEREGDVVMVINRGGFIKITPSQREEGLAMYLFNGGEFWKRYTVGGFVNYNNQDTALLYLDDRFLDSDAPLPEPRAWTFNMESNFPVALNIPALELFPAREGWNADTLRLGGDNLWYYRVSKKDASQPEIHLLRTENLAQAGIVISVDDFFSSVPQKLDVFHPMLPPLPEGFVYTGIARVGDSFFACWEEQEDFNIGAAGFMLIRG